MLCFFFFFSSRRRHTRLQGDWSSDVCSSDLVGFLFANNCGYAGNATKTSTQIEYIAPDGQFSSLTAAHLDRKSTRLNSSHLVISYAVFCLKKKTTYRSKLFYLATIQYTSMQQ